MQREEPPVMTTGLERIAVKARCESKLRFTSLAHHITKERVWENLNQIPAKSAAGVDGQTVTVAKESFEEWIAGMLQSVHRKGYRAPEIRRVYIPKPGKQEMRPLGVPTVADRALQRSYRHTVNQRLTSVVREIRTLRSVGAGRWATISGHPGGYQATGIPTATAAWPAASDLSCQGKQARRAPSTRPSSGR